MGVSEKNEVTGTSGSEVLTGTLGMVNYLSGGGGNDTLIGKDRADVAVYSGNRSDYTVTTVAGVVTVTDNRPGSPDGSDTLRGINILKFADNTLFVTLAANRVSLTGGVQTYVVANSEFVTGTASAEHFMIRPQTSAYVLVGSGDTVDLSGAITDYTYKATGSQLQISDGVNTTVLTVGGSFTLRTASGSTTVMLDFGAGGVIKLGTQVVGSNDFNAAAAVIDVSNVSKVISGASNSAPTVSALTTDDTTPTLTGMAVIGEGQTLEVTINGVTYTTATGVVLGTGNTWSLTLPADLAQGTIEVSAALVSVGVSASSAVSGTAGPDSLTGTAGMVKIYTGGAGNDSIIGKDRADVAVYTGNRSDYTVTTTAGVVTVMDNRPGSPDGTDTLRGINILQFADNLLFVTTAANRVSLAGGAQTFVVGNSELVTGTTAAEHFLISPNTSAYVLVGSGDTVDLSGAIGDYTYKASGTQLQISDGVNTTILTVGGSFTLRTASGSTTVILDFAAGGVIKLGTQVVGSGGFNAAAAITNAGNVSDNAIPEAIVDTSTNELVININDAPVGVLQMMKSSSNNTSVPAPEFQANSFVSLAQRESSTISLPDGGWLIVWVSNGQDGNNDGIYGQRYDVTGSKIGVEFQINTVTLGGQSGPKVALMPDGGWTVVWKSQVQDGYGDGLYGQHYDSQGLKIGSEFKINTTTFLDQNQPFIAALRDGGWVVVWVSNQSDLYGNIYIQRYSRDGEPIGGELVVNTGLLNYQISPSAVGLEDGGWVVTWASDHSNNQFDVFAQQYSADGSVSRPEFKVNTYITSVQEDPSIAALAYGGWVITWTSFDQDGSGKAVYGQIFDPDGFKVGQEFRINTYTNGDQSNSHVIALEDGGWLVVWQSDGQDAGTLGVYAQRFSAAGVKVGNEFRVNSTITNNQINPSASALKDGGWIISWDSLNQDGSSYGIYAQRYDVNGQASYTYTTTELVVAGDKDDFTEDKILYADASLISDADDLGVLAWQWQRSTDGGTTWTDIPGATGDSYTLGDADAGNLVRLKGTYTDGQGFLNTVYSGASTTVVNVEDEATGTLNVTGTAEEGGSLTASLSATDVDSGITDTAYQWQISSDGTTWTNISGATSATYNLAADQSQVGKFVRVVVTTTDSFGGTTVFTGNGSAAILDVNELPTGQLQLLAQSITTTLRDLNSTDIANSNTQYFWSASESGNNHIYEIINVPYIYKYTSGGVTWQEAMSIAASSFISGVSGYLVTITSQAEQDFISTRSSFGNLGYWMGASDADSEGVWKWVAGPEAGTQFWSGPRSVSGGFSVDGAYSNWTSNAPENPGITDYRQDYGVLTGTVIDSYYGTIEQYKWLSGFSSDYQWGYIIEYSGQVSEQSIGYSYADSIDEYTEGVTLKADSAFVSDGDGMGLINWQWQRSADGGNSWVDISGATLESYTLGSDDVGNQVRVKGSYVDGQGFYNEVFSAASLTISSVLGPMSISLTPFEYEGQLSDLASGEKITPSSMPIENNDQLQKAPVIVMPVTEDLESLLAGDSSIFGISGFGSEFLLLGKDPFAVTVIDIEWPMGPALPHEIYTGMVI